MRLRELTNEATGLSPATLSSYKKKAGAEASALDKEAFEKGGPSAQAKLDKAHKRYKGINKATQKQFDNDVKGIKEEVGQEALEFKRSDKYPDGKSIPESLPARYQPSSNPGVPDNQKCSNCLYYDTKTKKCDKFEGDPVVRPEYWCAKWKSAKVEESQVNEISTKLRDKYVTRATDDYGHANFAARASKSHPGLEKYSQEQEHRAAKRRAGLNRALSDKRLGRVEEKEVDEASLATMRDYFAGDENAKDEMKITQMRKYYANDAAKEKTKNFNSLASYHQWLKQVGAEKINRK